MGDTDWGALVGDAHFDLSFTVLLAVLYFLYFRSCTARYVDVFDVL